MADAKHPKKMKLMIPILAVAGVGLAYIVYRNWSANSSASTSAPAATDPNAYTTGGSTDLSAIENQIANMQTSQAATEQAVSQNQAAISQNQNLLYSFFNSLATSGSTKSGTGPNTKTPPGNTKQTGGKGTNHSAVLNAHGLVTDRTPGGKVVTGTNYKTVVNQAGGLNQNGHFVKGSYQGNKFVPLATKPTPPASNKKPATGTRPQTSSRPNTSSKPPAQSTKHNTKPRPKAG